MNIASNTYPQHVAGSRKRSPPRFSAQEIEKTIAYERAKMLVVTPRPYSRESLMPYSLRLTEENGYPTPSYFLKEYESSNFSVTRNFAIDRLVDSAGLSHSESERLAYSTKASRKVRMASLLGQTIGPYELRLGRPKICPYCIAENGFIEAAWDLAWIKCCPIHRVKLIDTCTACGKRLTWARQWMTKCKCGYDLTREVVERVGDKEAELARLFMDRLYADDATWSSAETSGQLWSKASLLDLCKLATSLSLRLSKHDKSKRRWIRDRTELFSVDHIDQLHAFFCGSTEARFVLYESMMIDQRTGKKAIAFHSAFKWVLNRKDKSRVSKVLSPLLTELFRFAALHWPSSRLDRTSVHFRQFVVKSQWLSVVEASKVLNITQATLSRGVRSGMVPHERVHEHNNHSILIPRWWLDKQNEMSRESYAWDSVRDETGLSLELIRLLRKEGLIKECFFSSRSSSLKHDVDQFVAHLYTHIRVKASSPKISSIEQITFREAMKLGRISHAAKVTLIKMILGGEVLALRKPSRSHLPNVMFDVRDIRNALYSASRVAGVELLTREVKEMLGINYVTPLIKGGHIVRLKSDGRSPRYCAKSVMRFHQTYVYAPMIFHEHGDVMRLQKVSRFVDGLRLLEVPTGWRNSSMWFVRRDMLPFIEIAMKYLGYVDEPRPNSPKEKRLFAEGLRLTLIHMQEFVQASG